MPPIFIVMYATLCLAALFFIYFCILRHFGLQKMAAVYAIFWCFLAGLMLSLVVDFSSDQIGFIR